MAKLDPLGILDPDLDSRQPPELTLEHYGWTEKDLDKNFALGPGILNRFKEAGIEKMTLREIIQHLERIYCELLVLAGTFSSNASGL
jgi:2-oxoglutarate dehydrogenase E1 component